MNEIPFKIKSGDLLKAGFAFVRVHLQIVLLLAILFSLVTAVIGESGYNAMMRVAEILREAPSDQAKQSIEIEYTDIQAILSSRFIMLLLLAVALIPFVRLCAGHSAPFADGIRAFFTRSIHACLHVIAGIILFALFLGATTLLAGLVSSAIGTFALFLSLFFSVITGFYIAAVCHLAIMQQSLDIKTSLLRIWKNYKVALPMLMGAYLIVFIGSLFLDLILIGLLTSSMPVRFEAFANLFVSNMTLFLAGAVFIAGVCGCGLTNVIARRKQM